LKAVLGQKAGVVELPFVVNYKKLLFWKPPWEQTTGRHTPKKSFRVFLPTALIGRVHWVLEHHLTSLRWVIAASP